MCNTRTGGSSPHQLAAVRPEAAYSSDAPGSLEVETYLAILAFILRENGYPAGDTPLSADGDALARYVIDEPPAE